MNFSRFKSWLSNLVAVRPRLRNACLWYLLYLMMATRQHTLRGAAESSGINRSQFSRFLKGHADVAVYSLEDLSKKRAKQFSGAVDFLAKATVPWKIGILIDSTIQGRSSLHPDNCKRFNHGQGFVIGHQWTNIALIINRMGLGWGRAALTI